MFRRFFLMICTGVFVLTGKAFADIPFIPPPKLINPVLVSLFNHDDGRIGVQRDAETPIFYNLDEQIEIKLQYQQDAIIDLPDDEILKLASLRIHHGRNVVIDGGALQATVPANEKIRGLIRAGGTRGIFYIHNVHLDANFQNGMDALLVGGYSNQNQDTYPDIFIQNVRMTGVENADGNIYHSDCFQFYGHTAITWMNGVDCETNTQGFFLAPQHHVGAMFLNNVSISYINPERANGYALYMNDTKDDLRVPIVLNNVYVDRRETNFGYGYDGQWEVYSVFPHAKMENGARRSGDVLTFPYYPEILGSILKYDGQRFYRDLR